MMSMHVVLKKHFFRKNLTLKRQFRIFLCKYEKVSLEICIYKGLKGIDIFILTLSIFRQIY